MPDICVSQFELALTDHDIPLSSDLCVEADLTLVKSARAVVPLLEREDRPTAIVCANDEMAGGVLVTAHRLGISVPEQLSVSGFGDTSAASLAWPHLTTVCEPFGELARIAVEVLVKEITDLNAGVSGGSCVEINVRNVAVIERESVAEVPLAAPALRIKTPA